LSLSRFAVARFRNLASQQVDVPPGVVLLIGPNGAGKTNVLEAVTVLANLASFRPVSPAAIVQRGATSVQVGGTITSDGATIQLAQQVTLAQRPVRRLWLGARRVSAAEYAAVFPVMALSSADREFLGGGPEARRRFLDRLAFFRHADALVVLQRYRRALRQRNALLLRGALDREIDPFESELARLGARVVSLRLEALAALEPELHSELDRLGWSLSRPILRYDCPDRLAPADLATMAQRLQTTLLRSRRLERVRGHTLIGPHRHDLTVVVGGAPAREVVSAGQGKVLVTALKLAAATLFAQRRGVQPVTVFDDVDAELDAEILKRLLERLADGRQALLSSPHEERVLSRRLPVSLWRVVAGTVTPVGSGGTCG
jgi:DNA replication and repair protein RecF